MAETTARVGLTPQQWDDEAFVEFVRENRFTVYQGTDENALIHMKEDLTRKPGDRVTFAAARAIGGGVTGNTVLEGNEAELDLRSMAVSVTPIRNAIVITDWDEQKSAVSLRRLARPSLMSWAKEKWREDIITALKSVPNAAGVMVPYEVATAAERNAWLVANSDRVQFGSAISNGASGVMSTALATVDAVNDKMTGALLSMAKRRALQARPRFRPFRVRRGDQEWYVVFMNSPAFRDFQADPAVAQANRDARVRGVETNPIFTGGELVWDGMIVREIPEMGLPIVGDATYIGQTGGILAGVGTAGIDVGFTFLCGAQAIGAAWARRLKSVVDERDYEFRQGLGVMEIRGVQKLMFGKGATDTASLVQNGVYTIFTAASQDL